MKKVVTKTFRLTTFCVFPFCLRAATLERSLMLLKGFFIDSALLEDIYISIGQCFTRNSFLNFVKEDFLFFYGVVIVDLKAYCYLACLNSFPKVFLFMKKGLDRFLSKCLVSPDELLIFDGRYCLEHPNGLGDF